MNNEIIYDQFSSDYDRFVNWEGRLAIELPFLTAELTAIKKGDRSPMSVLDAACGTGQHVIALTQLGFDCSGADLSRKMVDLAHKNAKAKNLEIVFKHAGFGQLSSTFHDQKFDSLICLGNSLPHILDEESMMETLGDFKSVLVPGGKIIIQNRNFDGILKAQNRWMAPETHQEGQHSWIFVRFYDFEPDGMIKFNIIILSDQNGGAYQQRIISTRLWPFTQMELVNWLGKSGFGNIRLFGNLQGSQFAPATSSNLVVVANAF